MSPAVSVVIPVYNEQRYVDSCLRSVLSQTFEDFEVVVVDDGSTDSTPDIVRRHAATDDRIRYHRQTNGGIVAALNTGLALAAAPTIARLDGDDEMMPDRLALQMQLLDDRPDLGGVATDFVMMDADGRRIGEVRSPLTSLTAVEDYLARGNPVVFPHSSMMFRHAVVDQVGGYRDEYRDSEDVDLFTRFIDAGHPIVVLPQVLLRHRIHSASISAGASRRQVGLNELIVLNSGRRRQGQPELSVAEHLGRRRTVAARLDFERRLLRMRLLRRSKMTPPDTSRATSWLSLVAAGALDPLRAARVLIRMRHRVR